MAGAPFTLKIFRAGHQGRFTARQFPHDAVIRNMAGMPDGEVKAFMCQVYQSTGELPLHQHFRIAHKKAAQRRADMLPAKRHGRRQPERTSWGAAEVVHCVETVTYPFEGRADLRHQLLPRFRERHSTSRTPHQRHTGRPLQRGNTDRKSTRLNSSHVKISYAVFCLKKKKNNSPSYTDTHRPRLAESRNCPGISATSLQGTHRSATKNAAATWPPSTATQLSPTASIP